MNGFIDLEDDIFQAHCALDTLQDHIENGATIRHVVDDVATLYLTDDSYTEINLAPVQRLLNALRSLT
jgi:hypothetical protein